MGAAATVSKDEDETCGQKTATSEKSRDYNKTTATVICSGCKTPLNIFKRKVRFIFYSFQRDCFLVSVLAHMLLFNVVETGLFL